MALIVSDRSAAVSHASVIRGLVALVSVVRGLVALASVIRCFVALPR